ncbi:RNA-directed DNA polymerase, eukaryota, partial [Tanacetum coccineum]
MKSSELKDVHNEVLKEDKSEDLFNIYEMLNKKKLENFVAQQSEGDLQYPPGFTPCDRSEVNSKLDQPNEFSGKGAALADSTASHKDNVNVSSCSGNFKCVITPKIGGSMLQLVEDLIKVGQTMGYKMEGYMNDIAKIETKMEQVDLFSIKSCWGNLTFDYVVSSSVGNSDRWKGDVIVMDDFNEVRSKEERYGSVFNARGVAAFNSFISTGGLVEVPSGGYSFTWSHKSTSKMSRLDRFLISEDLISSCPNLSSLILDRYISDHRPILLRELSLDYSPTLFRFFHNWLDLEGFEAFVADTWRSINIIDSNAMLKMEKKLKLLKGHIRVWVKEKKFSALNLKKDLKNKLSAIDSSIDKGKTTSASLEERLVIMNNLISLEKMESSKLAQKAKVKWSIKGDENSKKFHGIINKRRNNLAI